MIFFDIIRNNYEKALGSFSQFGPSHELVLAYKFKSDYSDDDEQEGRSEEHTSELQSRP